MSPSTRLQVDEFDLANPTNKAGGVAPPKKSNSGEQPNKPAGGKPTSETNVAKRCRTIDIPFPCQLLAVSPDGNLALTASTGSPQRLDVWSLTTGEHRVGWQPREGAASESRGALPAQLRQSRT